MRHPFRIGKLGGNALCLERHSDLAAEFEFLSLQATKCSMPVVDLISRCCSCYQPARSCAQDPEIADPWNELVDACLCELAIETSPLHSQSPLVCFFSGGVRRRGLRRYG